MESNNLRFLNNELVQTCDAARLQLSSYREWAIKDGLSSFANLQERVNGMANAFVRENISQDEDEETVRSIFSEASQHYEETFVRVRQSLANLFATGLFHLLEQLLVDLCRVRDSSVAPPGDTALAGVLRPWYRDHFELELGNLPSWEKVDELRLVANAVKHGEGVSVRQLRKRNPDLFKQPNPDLFFSSESDRVSLPLAGSDIFVSDDLLDTYGQAAESLLAEVGQHFRGSDTRYPIAKQSGPIEPVGDWQISPSYKKSDWVAGKVPALQLLEDQINGWFLDFAKNLADPEYHEHGALAALMLCCSLFERLESIDRQESSDGKSKMFFTTRACDVFEGLDKPGAEQLYDAARNGLYHEAMIRHGLELSHDAPDALKATSRPGPEGGLLLTINPAKFVATLEQHFADWLENVKDDLACLAYIEGQFPLRQAPVSGATVTARSGASTLSE